MVLHRITRMCLRQKKDNTEVTDFNDWWIFDLTVFAYVFLTLYELLFYKDLLLLSKHWNFFTVYGNNSPFYSYSCKRGWSWPCFDTTLLALLCKSCSSYANYYFFKHNDQEKNEVCIKTRSTSPSYLYNLVPRAFHPFFKGKALGTRLIFVQRLG